MYEIPNGMDVGLIAGQIPKFSLRLWVVLDVDAGNDATEEAHSDHNLQGVIGNSLLFRPQKVMEKRHVEKDQEDSGPDLVLALGKGEGET